MSADVGHAVFEAPIGVAGLDDVAVMGEPVEHGGCHFGDAEGLGPVGGPDIRIVPVDGHSLSRRWLLFIRSQHPLPAHIQMTSHGHARCLCIADPNRFIDSAVFFQDNLP